MENFLINLDGDIDVTYEEFKQFLMKILGDDDPKFLSRCFNLISDPMGAISAESYQEALKALGFEPAEKGELEKFNALVEKTKTDNPAACAGELVNNFDTDIDGELCIYEMPRLLAESGVTLPVETIFHVFVDLDMDDSMKIGDDELSSFLWDYWTSNPSIVAQDELVIKAFEAKLEELSGKHEEPSNVTIEEVQASLEKFGLVDAEKLVFENFLNEMDLGSCSDLDKHVIDHCVYDFLVPLTPEHTHKWVTFFKIKRDKDEEPGSDDEDEDWKEEVIDELLDGVRDVYLHIQAFLGAFSKGGVTLDIAGFSKCINFLELNQSEETIAEVFSRVDNDDSMTIELCELGPGILKAFKETDNSDSIFLIKTLFNNLAEKVVATN